MHSHEFEPSAVAQPDLFELIEAAHCVVSAFVWCFRTNTRERNFEMCWSKAKSLGVDFMEMNHIAIMMDGNGRWAKKRLLPVKAGHAAGAQALRKLAEKMNAADFKILTVFAFSTENWKRSPEEVAGLMALLRKNIQEYIDDSKKNNMRIGVIGDVLRLDDDLREKIAYLTELTKNHTGMRVNIAINYGGRDDIVRAAKKMIADGIRPAEVNEKLFSSYVDAADMPDPDLFIRTGGDFRVSNFMLWQFAYTEFYYCDKLWPDFNFDDLKKAVASFENRERRFGSRL